MVSEWPRSSNSTRLVFAGEWRYCLRVDLVMASGTVWSLPPIVSKSGPRSGLSVSTLSGEWGERLGAAASKRGRPGDGTAHLSYSSLDSSSETALPKLKRNCSAVRETDLCLLAGFLNTGRVACNEE